MAALFLASAEDEFHKELAAFFYRFIKVYASKYDQ
jgi:hypothetical protein